MRAGLPSIQNKLRTWYGEPDQRRGVSRVKFVTDHMGPGPSGIGDPCVHAKAVGSRCLFDSSRASLGERQPTLEPKARQSEQEVLRLARARRALAGFYDILNESGPVVLAEMCSRRGGCGQPPCLAQSRWRPLPCQTPLVVGMRGCHAGHRHSTLRLHLRRRIRQQCLEERGYPIHPPAALRPPGSGKTPSVVHVRGAAGVSGGLVGRKNGDEIVRREKQRLGLSFPCLLPSQ